MAVHSIFLDTNIVIDLLLQRVGELDEINSIFIAGRDDRLSLCLSESVISTVLYVCKIGKDTSAIDALLRYATVLPITKEVINRALSSKFKDKEDAILYHLAWHHKLSCFITRDKKDFAGYALPELPVMSPRDFLKKLG